MKTVKVKYKQGDMVQIVFEKHYIARVLKMHKVGQYMFVNFPLLNVFEWHPFSISSGPDEVNLEIHVKALGDHTRKLVDIAKTSSEMWIRTDGPYGNLKLNYRRFPFFLLTAGGIGVTPVIGIIKDIYRYGQLDPQAKRHHKSYLEKVFLIWTISSEEQFRCFEEEIRWFSDHAGKDGLPALDVKVFVTKGSADGNSFLVAGKPNYDSYIASLNKECDLLENSLLVFACGPRKMVNMCWDAASDQQREGASIHFHHETFEF